MFGFKRSQRGIGLVEGVMFGAVALALVVGGIAYYKQTSEAEKVNDAVRSIIGIQSGVRSLYVGSRQFGPEGQDLVPATVTSGSVNPGLVTTEGRLINEWNGDVTVTGYQSGFTVDYGDVPREACVRMAPHTVHGSGLAGSGIAAVAINGTLVDANLDGRVSPEEAAAACGLVAESSPAVMNMRWAFLPGGVGKIAQADLEDILDVKDPTDPVDPPPPTDPDVTETGRTTETDSGACDEGFVGNRTRSRVVVTYSDGSVVTGEWSGWDESACRAADTVEVSRTNETESAACDTGFVGQQTRQRTVITYASGRVAYGSWSSWDQSACLTNEVKSSTSETQSAACEDGFLGNQTRSRTVTTYMDNRVVYGSWSSWNTSQCIAQPIDSRVFKRETLHTCTSSGKSGFKRVRESWTRSKFANGSTSDGPVSTSAGSCVTQGSMTMITYKYVCSTFGQSQITTDSWYVSGGKLLNNSWNNDISCKYR